MKQTFSTAPLMKMFRPSHLSRILTASVSLAIGISSAAPAVAQSSAPRETTASTASQTAQNYVTTFYPLWFTYYQSSNAKPNQLVGPDRVSPLYQTVVAVNVDTLYASSFTDLSTPAVLTIPKSSVSFSTLVLDRYGDILTVKDEASQGSPFKFLAGNTYVLNGPGFSGLPSGVPSDAIPVSVPADHPVIIFRVDKYVSDSSKTDPLGNPIYHSEIRDAETFRKSLQLQSHANYVLDPTIGQTQIIPESNYAVPLKSIADLEIDLAPTLFLNQLQSAVADNISSKPGLTPAQTTLANSFNALVGTGKYRQDLAAGAQAAHTQIVENYLNTRVGGSSWIHFDDIGAWWPDTQIDPTAQALLNRSSITEYIQYANNITASSYFQTFVDGSGEPLDGSTPGGYQLTFTKEQLPDATRFWSITAYTPDAIELIPNALNKYHVACYTPNLQYNSDGSLTLYFAIKKPDGVPEANYVPVLPGKFNVMLRVYGPTGSTQNPGYVPPAITKAP